MEEICMADSEVAKRFCKINRYARNNGFVGGFPIFHEAWFNGNPVIGAYFLNERSAECRTTSKDFLKDAVSDIDLMSAVNDVGVCFGFSMGFPTYHKVDTECGVQFESVFLLPGCSEYREVDCQLLRISQGDSFGQVIKKVHDYACSQGFKSALPCKLQNRDGEFKVGMNLFSANVLKWKALDSVELFK